MKLSTSWESIDVHLLQILRALLSECSVSSAARKLNLSQPAVSTALRRLRAQYHAAEAALIGPHFTLVFGVADRVDLVGRRATRRGPDGVDPGGVVEGGPA